MLIHIIITLIIVGVLLWLINTYIPMASSIKTILNVVVVIAVVLWLLHIFGIFSSMSRVHGAPLGGEYAGHWSDSAGLCRTAAEFSHKGESMVPVSDANQDEQF
jgi:type IV secretory pathway TrbL component